MDTSYSSPTFDKVATKPTLTYFPTGGRAKVARLLLEDAGVDYDYVSLADWPQQKPQPLATGMPPLPNRMTHAAHDDTHVCSPHAQHDTRHIRTRHASLRHDTHV